MNNVLYPRKNIILNMIGVFLIVILGIFSKYLLLDYETGGKIGGVRYPDEKNYYIDGANFILNDGLKFLVTPRSFYNPPLNLFYLAILKNNIALARILNICIVSFVGVFIWILVRRSVGTSLAFLALIVYSLYYPILHHSGTVLSEPLFISLLIISFFIFSRFYKNNVATFISGIFMALATFARPATYLFPYFLFGIVFILSYFFTEKKFHIWIKPTFIFLIGFSLLVIPYCLKNYFLFKKFGMSTGSGAVLYLGNDLKKNGDEPCYSDMDFNTYKLTKEYSHLDLEGDRRLTEAGIEMIKKYPLDVFFLTLRKVPRFLFGNSKNWFFPKKDIIDFYKNENAWRIFFILSSMVILVFITMSAFVGTVVNNSQNKDLGALKLFAISFVIYMIAVHVPLFPIARMAIPAFPFLLVLAMLGISNYGKYIKQRRWFILIGTILVVLAILFGNLLTKDKVVSKKYVNYFSKIYESNNLAKDKRSQITSMLNGESVFIFDEIKLNRNQAIFLTINARKGDTEKIANAFLEWGNVNDKKEFASIGEVAFKVYGNNQNLIYRLLPIWWGGNLSFNALKITIKERPKNFRMRLKKIVIGE